MHSSMRVSSTAIPSQQPVIGATRSSPLWYVYLPHKLLTAHAYDSLAIGIYSLIARLYLVVHTPVPLSTADVQRYDPSLSRGAIIRAIDRLIEGGWLVISEQIGHKTRYVPTWGRIGSAPRPWRMDLPHLGRPQHIYAMQLDLQLLDLYMGKLTLHPTRPALITRYVTQPLLNLRDVGAYALTFNSIPTTTPRLEQWGLVEAGECMPLPSDRALLARVSQQILEDEHATTLTPQGWRKLGLVPPAPRDPAPERGEILTFVPPDMIDQVIGEGIAEVIASEHDMQMPSSAPQCAETEVSDTPATIPWESLGIQRDDRTPPQPPQRVVGGGMPPGDAARGRGQAPKTEVAQLLHTLNVRPRQVAEVADAPLELVRAAIADGQARPYVRDLAGWVVALVRDARDQGWRIEPPVAPSTEAHAAALRASFERLRAEGLGGAGDDVRPSEDEPRSEDLPPAVAQEATPLAGTVADAQTDAEEEPHETLTAQLQRELRARTYPDLHPLIVRLSVWQDGDTLTLGCARTSDLPIVQARLLPLIRAVVMELGCSQSLRLAVAAQPSRSPESPRTALPTAAVGVRPQHSP